MQADFDSVAPPSAFSVTPPLKKPLHFHRGGIGRSGIFHTTCTCTCSYSSDNTLPISIDSKSLAGMIDTASLSDLLNGKALKALSDGSVDFYAVAVSIWLGKQISLRPSVGSTVHDHIASRGSVESALAKSLSIGWGHSTVVVDLTKTEAGTNALLLIGALATGTSPSSAAQCLSELLALSGAEADSLPNVCVLQQLVSYLAPFVYDLGFSKVLEAINTAGLRMIARHNGDVDANRSRLESLGTAPAWAAAIKHLLTAQERDESIYLETRFRGSWLAAFASHVLGMSTEVHLGDVQVWSSTGDRGRVVFQLATSPSTTKPAPTIINSPPPPRNGPKRIEIDYLLGDALEALLLQDGDLSPEYLSMVQRSISREALAKLSKVTAGHGLVTRKTLDKVLKVIGISEDALNKIDASTIAPLTEIEDDIGPYLRTTGLDHVAAADWDILTSHCDHHRDKSPSEVLNCGIDTTKRCFCGRVGGIILGFACSALALMFCQFDPAQVRMQGSVLTGSHVTTWSRHVTRNDRVGDMRFDHILLHIIHLVSGSGWVDSAVEERSAGAEVVGLSTGSYTVSYTGILEKDCFDEIGRFLTLQSGRPSLNGVLRSMILQTESTGFLERPVQQPSGTALAAGSPLKPHYAPSEINVRFLTRIAENAIIVDTEIGTGSSYKKVLMEEGMHRLLFGVKAPECAHDPNTPYQVAEGEALSVSGFVSDSVSHLPGMKKAVFALQGNKLEQLLVSSAVSSGHKLQVLQLRACLECSIQTALATDGPSCVIIG